MTDERTRDETVSATYRQLAGERSPAQLDDKVLRMAANRTQHAGYVRSIGWTRPLAWAATIALCLAITLEISQVDEPQGSISLPTATDTMHYEAAPAAVENDASTQQKMEPTAGQASAVMQDSAIAERKDSAAMKRSRLVEDEPHAAPPAANLTAPAAAFDLPAGDRAMLQQAEEMARLQNGTNSEPAAAARALQSPAACADEVRTEPQSWLHCIESLAEIGAAEAAERERKRLVEVFPDFKLP